MQLRDLSIDISVSSVQSFVCESDYVRRSNVLRKRREA